MKYKVGVVECEILDERIQFTIILVEAITSQFRTRERRNLINKMQQTGQSDNLQKIMLKYPSICTLIFSNMDCLDTLRACREVSRVWRYHVDRQTTFWSRVQDSFDEKGLTPLHLAASMGDYKVCR